MSEDSKPLAGTKEVWVVVGKRGFAVGEVLSVHASLDGAIGADVDPAGYRDVSAYRWEARTRPSVGDKVEALARLARPLG